MDNCVMDESQLRGRGRKKGDGSEGRVEEGGQSRETEGNAVKKLKNDKRIVVSREHQSHSPETIREILMSRVRPLSIHD